MVCIDTSCARDGWLTAKDTNTCRFRRASRGGEQGHARSILSGFGSARCERPTERGVARRSHTTIPPRSSARSAQSSATCSSSPASRGRGGHSHGRLRRASGVGSTRSPPVRNVAVGSMLRGSRGARSVPSATAGNTWPEEGARQCPAGRVEPGGDAEPVTQADSEGQVHHPRQANLAPRRQWKRCRMGTPDRDRPASFRRDGFVVLDRFLSAEEVTELRPRSSKLSPRHQHLRSVHRQRRLDARPGAGRAIGLHRVQHEG